MTAQLTTTRTKNGPAWLVKELARLQGETEHAGAMASFIGEHGLLREQAL